MTFNSRLPIGVASFSMALACFLVYAISAGATVEIAPKAPEPSDPPAESEGDKPALAKPFDSLAAGYKEAQRTRRPLFVRVGGESCPWCHKLETDLESPAGQSAVEGFTLVAIDADKSPDDARTLGVSAIPALRVVSPAGRILDSRDGYLPAEDLAEWLGSHRDAATAETDEELIESASEQPTALGVVKIVRHFGDRDPRIREAAIRRLRSHPEVARAIVVKALCEGNLNSQLTALDLVATWKGPVNDLDPWRPETMTEARKEELRRWAGQPLPEETIKGEDEPPTLPEKQLDAQQLADAREELKRLLAAKPTEVEAICERLSRFSMPLLDEIAAQAKANESDEARHRLLLLRYRILASDALALRWPGGLPRLAAVASEERRKALEELNELAGPDDLPLLTELFRDSDPLVRELALRALREVGGAAATKTLVGLLDDPEPNVRAAVLKLLSEAPEESSGYGSEPKIELEPELVDKIAKYAMKETDSDLVVHAIRVLKAVESARATATLVSLFKHSSWQARAEAAEAVGKRLARHSYGEPDNSEVQSRLALADLLDDADAFVVSKALESLPGDSAAVVDRMVAVTEKHPSLTLHVIGKLGDREGGSDKVLEHLRAFAKHVDAGTRAAAIERLVSTTGGELQDEEVTRWLTDGDTKVRIAAAMAIEQSRVYTRPSARERSDDGPPDAFEDVPEAAAEEESDSGVFGTIVDLFKPRRKDAKPTGEKPVDDKPAEEKPAESKPEDAKRSEGEPTTPAPTDDDAEANENSESVPEGAAESVPRGSEEPPSAVPSDEVHGAAPDANGGEASSPNRLDVWLADSAAGKNHPTWSSAALPVLERMLAATDRDERGAAALALASLGRVDQGIAPLLKEASSSAADFARAARTLTWLPWARRKDVFDKLLSATGVAPESYYILVSQFAEISDPRDADLLWEQLADENAAPKRAEVISRALERCLFGERHYGSEESVLTRKKAMEKLEPRLVAGQPWQRIVALSLLLPRSVEETVIQAEKLVANEALPERIRCLAFQMQLLASGEADRRKLSIAAISSNDTCRQRLALACLTDGAQSMQYAGELGYLYVSRTSEVHFSSSDDSKVIVPEAPKGLQLQHVAPLLAQGDGETKARAGYLLALLGEAEGLKPLLDYWKSDKGADEAVARLVYRAVAALDDESQLAVLKQIYATLKDGYEIREFYWTVRGMSGKSILEFRGQMRKELGMERLN